MSEGTCDIGMVGLGVMGRNLALNMAEHGFGVAGYDTDQAKVQLLGTEGGLLNVRPAGTLAEFVAALRVPRAIMLLVPAGPPVDAVIRELLPYLAAGDVLIDGGNSHFHDTDVRGQMLAAKGIDYLGVGVSGGEQGARHGPSLMPGGPRPAYERVRSVFEAVAARADGQPCVAYLGPGSAGHYVKMVHNGIEYGMMQLLAETYDLLRRGLGLSDDDLNGVFERWDEGELSGYLMEITARIFCRVDDQTGKRLIDVILDEAGQKGTGMWTSESAMDLGVPIPTIDVAVAMRNLSGLKEERAAAGHLLGAGYQPVTGDRAAMIDQLGAGLYAALILTYAQGMALLAKASTAYDYRLNLATVAGIWRGGCIIRSALLQRICAAYATTLALPNLALDPHLAHDLNARQAALRGVVQIAAAAGIPTPGLSVSLAYLDAYRSPWLPANLIQAQRDYFGAHTYERVDAKGVFHTQWEG
jgi:6-phosphogluconate dehydrogenase